MTLQQGAGRSEAMPGSRRRWLANRALMVAALLALAAGVALGHAAITWLNASLL